MTVSKKEKTIAAGTVAVIFPKTRAAWRNWLSKNHTTATAVWLTYRKSVTGKRTLSWSEAVEEALCFGWIDSKAKPIDEATYMQFFSKRKVKSVWSRINKEKVHMLAEAGLMSEAGLACITEAKQNGSWTALDEVEQLIVPKDLETALRVRKGARQFFTGLAKSSKKSILHWIAQAKTTETRQKRILETATLAAVGLKPKQFR